MKQYLELVKEVLNRGTRKTNRTGVDTVSAFNINYSVDMGSGFPLLTTKKISWKNIVVENLWFLSGDLHVGLMQKHGCKIWDPWADDAGYVPSAYGNFWRNFPVHDGDSISFNDQVRYVLRTLRESPDSRRMVISAWAPGNAQGSALPPCHLMFIFNVQYTETGEPRLCLHLTQRSCDVALGVPYNIAGYAFLLHLFAHLVGIRPGIFGHSLVDAHIYTAKPDGSMAEYDHVPGLREQLLREPRPRPQLTINPALTTLDDVLALCNADLESILAAFRIDGYDPQPAIAFKVAV
ncbi:MAG: thymidylate synthase [Candidatus Poseidoniia archaeon]|nr:thymidylate synthase [Candidatus Poseidoniia archaeon]MDP7081738.1 thymidylate synthase [Candidatus Poseidoniia archaeon]MDP7255928.1 thymidylate synthase [Candidatus Poseidoniia archaeon]MDP7473918.1 thymidylate synthase [Candidatus Poseidoniia archaeon]MDP7538384.1 thymidylate synthase [Candidatus Poseidoniia archaeon]